MAKTNSTLIGEEIEEELINDDLMSKGVVEDETMLQQMCLQEKKNLLRGIQQSKEDFQKEPTVSSRTLKKPIIIDTSKTEFTSLSAAAKSNKLKLPRRQSAASKQVDSDEGRDQYISLLDDDDDDDESLFTKPKKFTLPYCVNDNTPALPKPDRAIRRDECPYFQMNGENAEAALRRMLYHHDAWKSKYTAEISKSESQATGKNIQDSNDKESTNDKDSDNESDPYTFTEVTKVYSGPGTKKRETNKTFENVSPLHSRTLQRRTSRDSDCEEIQPTLKPEEPKLSEWLTAARPRNKRNRKQSNQGRTQDQPDVEFAFDRTLWNGGRSSGGPQSPAPTRRSMPGVSEVLEAKVQCPICQRDYLRSVVENHAATCEGFSSSPMDVEEGM